MIFSVVPQQQLWSKSNPSCLKPPKIAPTAWPQPHLGTPQKSRAHASADWPRIFGPGRKLKVTSKHCHMHCFCVLRLGKVEFAVFKSKTKRLWAPTPTSLGDPQLKPTPIFPKNKIPNPSHAYFPNLSESQRKFPTEAVPPFSLMHATGTSSR